ncbi:multidrug transporter [Marinilabilia rubra]|uniref:Multidrug transporter n=1 Tax=Marinilabilia rubra TaxID=2162893 RepID=A0A2U2B499_9BACT|nr:multidrug transporter [Marinilabilia rubra]
MKRKNKSSWVIGGTTMVGLGIGFIFLQKSVLIFMASLIIGIGLV